MRTVVLDIETIPDERAMACAGYQPSEEFAPFTLHEIACASVLIVDETGGRLDFRLASFSRERSGERAIVAEVERKLASAGEFLTFNGEAHDLPVLIARGLLAEVSMDSLRRYATKTPPARHVDLLREVRSYGAPAVSLRNLCAPLRIPVKPDAHARVVDLAARGAWDAVERYCEGDVVATWLAAQMWRSITDPEYGQRRWEALADWIAAEQPRLTHLLPYAVPPAWPLAGRCLGDDDAIF